MANILLTGASGDIGLATARLFAAKGHNLALIGHSSFQKLVEEKILLESEYGISCECIKCDVSNPSEVKAAVEHAYTVLGFIDLLINNAGISLVALDQDLSPVEWHRICETNLSSVMYFCRCVIPKMITAKSGRIINISSMWGGRGASCEAAYSATKGGIDAYTKALGKELAPSGIPVNAIAFGAIDTKMNDHLTDEEKQQLADEIPFGRMAAPDEAAEMIYTVYTAPVYMTSQIIGFDGGY